MKTNIHYEKMIMTNYDFNLEHIIANYKFTMPKIYISVLESNEYRCAEHSPQPEYPSIIKNFYKYFTIFINKTKSNKTVGTSMTKLTNHYTMTNFTLKCITF